MMDYRFAEAFTEEYDEFMKLLEETSTEEEEG